MIAQATVPTTSRFAKELNIFRLALTARRIDEVEMELVNRGDAFFHVSGAGHEASLVFAQHLRPEDFIHCHYRDKALMLARGIAPEEFFNCLLCNAASNSHGRQMSAHLSSPKHNVLSLVGPIGNNALQAAGVAAEIKDNSNSPIVLCSVGDGTSQQGEVLEAIAEAVRWELPVLFVIENNRYAISVKTLGKTLFSHPDGIASEFYGLPIHHVNGHDALACDVPFGTVVDSVRTTRRPAILVLDVERLSDHSNSDDERTYRDSEEVALVRSTSDPITIIRERLLSLGIPESDIVAVESSVKAEVDAAAALALQAAQPSAIFDANAPLPQSLANADEYAGCGVTFDLTMMEAIRETLKFRMASDPRITLYGEDIEDPKGDVFGVTRGLTEAFPTRVKNSPVSESTIVGTSIGRALAGGRPVAFIQFADFLPLAFNQIATELGSMHWRTDGGWTCPVVIMVACGGYRPGLGPFHAHTFESVMTHVPGVDVVMPSSAGDAAGMLNAAFESGRPTVFFYPKACLNDRTRATSSDVDKQIVPVGASRTVRSGHDITLVSWGNTVQLCEKVADALSAVDVSADVIDLRWLAPWDRAAVCKSAKHTGKLIVVHEDNRTVGFGAEVVATVAERVESHVECRRVTRPDTYVPCNFTNQLDVLPSFKSILTEAAKLLALDLTWELPEALESGLVVVEAVGSSPADETVTVLDMVVSVGQHVAAGDLLASIECDKAIFEFCAPVGGIVETVHLAEGQEAAVGSPMITIRTDAAQTHYRQTVREVSGEPRLARRVTLESIEASPTRSSAIGEVFLSNVYAVTGTETVTNSQLIQRFPGMSENDIFTRTGIEQRLQASEHQTALSMAVDAVLEAFKADNIGLRDIDLIICSTSTPQAVAPSLACLILDELSRRVGVTREIPAYDLLAACTGYLYALTSAYDHIQSNPAARVLVVTSELMSSVVDPNDFGTVTLFGDAATATIVSGIANPMNARARLYRPILSARAEDGSALSVPLAGNDRFVQMKGKTVFAEGVRTMSRILEAACKDLGYDVADLDVVIPHQANGRIIDAVRNRLKLRSSVVRNEIANLGNTSSSSIPIVLADELRGAPGRRIGLSAFGAGFTFGAAIVETL